MPGNLEEQDERRPALSEEDTPVTAVMAVRSELREQRRLGQLAPQTVARALDHLTDSGAGLDQILGVVFDFVELDWLPEVMAPPQSAPPAYDYDALAAELGLDPKTGRPLHAASEARGSSSPIPQSTVHLYGLPRIGEPSVASVEPSNETLPCVSKVVSRPPQPLVNALDGVARQKPLSGWGGPGDAIGRLSSKG